MKIGIFFSLNNYGGVQTCLIALIKGLNRLGIEPFLLTDAEVNQKIVTECDLRLKVTPIEFSISRGLMNKVRPFFQGAWDMIYFFRTSKLKDTFDFLYIFQPNIIVDSDTPHLYYLSMAPRSPGYSRRRFLP